MHANFNLFERVFDPQHFFQRIWKSRWQVLKLEIDNGFNRTRRRASIGRNSSGYRGVRKNGKMFCSQIKINGVQDYGPTRDTAKQAAEELISSCKEMVLKLLRLPRCNEMYKTRGAVRVCDDCDIEYNDRLINRPGQRNGHGQSRLKLRL